MFKVEVLAPISTTHIQIRAIAAENRMPSMPIRSLAGCITNTSSRSPARDSIFADHKLESRLDKKVAEHDAAIAAILSAIRELMNPPIPKRRGIGFTAKI
jgi:hypothetical protein